MRKIAKKIMLAVTVCAGLIGCQKTGSHTAIGSAPSVEEQIASESGMEELKEEDQIIIGVSLLNNAHVFYNNIEEAMRDTAVELDYQLLIQDAAGDGNRQLNQVQDFITQKVDAIVICPTNSAGSKSMVELADAAGIPVFTMDIASDGNVISHIATDNYTGGELAAEYMVNFILNHETGDVAVITYSEIESCVDREKGFTDWIAENAPEVTVIDIQNYSGDQGKAAEVMQNMLLKHENLKGVFCVGDPAAVGAMSSIEAAGSQVKVIGFDGNPEGIEAIKSGGNWVADVAQDPAMIGKQTLECIDSYLKGEKVEKVIPISPKLIDAETLK